MTRAVVLALGFLVLVATTACGQVNAQMEVSWSAHPLCAPLTDRQWQSLAHAVDLWSEIDVQLPEESDPEVAYILVCFADGKPHDGAVGWTHREGEHHRIDLDARETDEQDRDSVTVHEFGHVILPGSADLQHLPDGEFGIMASGTLKQPAGPLVEWTPDDDRHLHDLGFDARSGD